MGFIEMLVHTFIEKGHVYNHPFQNEASNGSFTLECNRNLCFKAFLCFIGFYFPLHLEPCAAPAFVLLVCSLITVCVSRLLQNSQMLWSFISETFNELIGKEL